MFVTLKTSSGIATINVQAIQYMIIEEGHLYVHFDNGDLRVITEDPSHTMMCIRNAPMNGSIDLT